MQVSRFDAVTDFLVYTAPVILLLQLPLLDAAGLAPSLFWYLIPTMAPLLLLKAAFSSITTVQWVYALVVSIAWVVVMFAWARHACQRNIVLKEASP